MKILVFGAGFIGRRLARSLPGAVLDSADIASEFAVRHAIGLHRPDAVINAAGKTGRPNVDWCELHQRETLRSNVQGPLVLARACQDARVHLVHLSSGCIFDGPSPTAGGWREDDHANPGSFYARTKYAADLVLARLPDVAVVRIRMPVDDSPGPRNLITKLAGYRYVVDVENSITVVADLIRVLDRLVACRASGVYHATNPGAIRHRDLLALYREHVDPTHACELITKDELISRGLVKTARSSCLLASEHLARLGIDMRPAEPAVCDAMMAYARCVQAAPGPAPGKRASAGGA